MKIWAVLPGVTQLEVDFDPKKTVAELTRTVCRKFGIEEPYTRILLAGKLLPKDAVVGRILGKTHSVTVDYLWARQVILWGTDRQRKFRRSSVIVAGAGAIGNEVSKNLAMLGLRRLVIVDNDRVELSNLSRMIFFHRADVGKPKAKVLAERLSQLYPHLETVGLNCTIENVPLNIFLDSDLIVCGLDNLISRMFLAELSRRYTIPIVDGGVIGFHARVQSYVPPDDPCLLCGFPTGDYARLVGLRNPCDAPVEDAKVPSLPTTISLVSSVQTQEATKILLGLDEFRASGKWPAETGVPLRGTLIIDLRYNRYGIFEVKRNQKCYICGRDGVAKDTVPVVTLSLDKSNRTSEISRKIESIGVAKPKRVSFFGYRAGRRIPLKGTRRLRNYARPGNIIHALVHTDNDYKEIVFRLTVPKPS